MSKRGGRQEQAARAARREALRESVVNADFACEACEKSQPHDAVNDEAKGSE